MHQGIIYAVIAALSFGAWTVFHDLAAKKIDTLFGAIIVSLTAVILGALMIAPRLKTSTLYSDPKGIVFAVLAGVCALVLDYFALKAYSTGIPVSTAGPIIIGGSIVVASVAGFMFLGENITIVKIAAIGLIVVGSAILAA